jgi:heterodisulfide reductase subunit A-like polyferredoxin
LRTSKRKEFMADAIYSAKAPPPVANTQTCEKFCPTGAINFTDTEAVVTVNVGAVILAPGYQVVDPGGW